MFTRCCCFFVLLLTTVKKDDDRDEARSRMSTCSVWSRQSTVSAISLMSVRLICKSGLAAQVQPKKLICDALSGHGGVQAVAEAVVNESKTIPAAAAAAEAAKLEVCNMSPAESRDH